MKPKSYESVLKACLILAGLTVLGLILAVIQRETVLISNRQAIDPDLSIVSQLSSWLRFLVSLGYIGCGLWIIVSQSNTSSNRIFALLSLSISALLGLENPFVQNAISLTDVSGTGIIKALLYSLSVLIPGFWLHFWMVFPSRILLIRLLRYQTYFACYFFPVANLVGAFIFDGESFNTLAAILKIGLAATFLGGVVLMFVRLQDKKDKLERRQTSLVATGFSVGILAQLICYLIVWILTDWYTEVNPEILHLFSNFVLVFLLLIPISIVFAIRGYRLLEIQGRLLRGTRIILLAAILLLGFFGVAYGITNILNTRLGISNPLLTITVILLLALGALILTNRIWRTLGSKLNSNHKQLVESMENLLASPEYLVDDTKFWAEFENRLTSGLSVKSAYPVLAGVTGKEFWMVQRSTTPFQRESAFVTLLEGDHRTVHADELIAGEQIQLSDSEKQWFQKHQIALIAPLLVENQLAGFIGIGEKIQNKDFNPEEISTLDQLAPKIASASVNLQLVEENIDKRRLKEQMEIARRIQEGFLPQTLPRQTGLEIAAGCRFSLEVAGDYYDVVNLNSGEIIFAIGDVSGKGACAALIMANLQTCLRTVLGLGLELEKCVERINDLIYTNTSPEQFITFFVAKYNPQTEEVLYVNAGHNPPYLITRNGECRLLENGGLILGVIPDLKYETGRIKLTSGDVLVLYTDGVSEAMNGNEEEFGETRIRDLVTKCHKLSPSELLQRLERDVVDFCGHAAKEDDSTLLIIKKA